MSLPVNQILCGDCCQLLKSIPDKSIDLVVTDPPYAIGFMGKTWDKQLPPKEAFQEMFRVLKDGALAFVMSSPRQDVMWRMLKLLEDCGFEMRQSWAKQHGFLNVPKASSSERNQGCKNLEGTVRFGSLPESGKMLPSKSEHIKPHKIKGNAHPTVKPVKLMAYLIELGCQPKGIVLDPFCGSGSTLIAAQMLGRKWMGIEIDAEYCKIAEARVKEVMRDRSIEEFTEA
jgi:site-specific DNA-methyltransferase (adenine-specific)